MRCLWRSEGLGRRRSKYSREWRYARKRGNAEEIEICKKRYLQQKGVTAVMTGNKKSNWEEKK